LGSYAKNVVIWLFLEGYVTSNKKKTKKGEPERYLRMWLLLLLPRTLIDPEYDGEEEEAKPAGQLIEFSTFSLLIFLSLPSFFQFDLQVSAILIGIQFQCERRERRRRRSNSLLKESHAHTHAHTHIHLSAAHTHTG